jgi:hypothetical protein
MSIDVILEKIRFGVEIETHIAFKNREEYIKYGIGNDVFFKYQRNVEIADKALERIPDHANYPYPKPPNMDDYAFHKTVLDKKCFQRFTNSSTGIPKNVKNVLIDKNKELKPIELWEFHKDGSIEISDENKNLLYYNVSDKERVTIDTKYVIDFVEIVSPPLYLKDGHNEIKEVLNSYIPCPW